MLPLIHRSMAFVSRCFPQSLKSLLADALGLAVLRHYEGVEPRGEEVSLPGPKEAEDSKNQLSEQRHPTKTNRSLAARLARSWLS